VSDGDRIALCVARFYADVAEVLVARARAALRDAGHDEVDELDVPGAFELPLAVRYAAESGRYAGIVALGAVVRGETDHYYYVCAEAARGIQQVQLLTGVPCGFGVLTVDSIDQALARADGDTRDSGRAAVEAMLATLDIKRRMEQKPGRTGFTA